MVCQIVTGNRGDIATLPDYPQYLSLNGVFRKAKRFEGLDPDIMAMALRQDLHVIGPPKSTMWWENGDIWVKYNERVLFQG